MSGLDVEPAEAADEDDNTIEVTPTDSVSDEPAHEILDDASEKSVEGPRYVLYGGKGGVGKTTMAAATALDSARTGVRTLVVSTDPAHSLSDAFETEITAEPTVIHDEYPLFAVEIDPAAAMDAGQSAFDLDAGTMGGLDELVGEENPMGDLFGGSMPGSDEAAAMQLLLEYLDDDRFGRVVVDTAPTGHTLRLLELPELMDSMLGRIIAFRERIGDVLGGLGGLFGGESPEDATDEGVDDLRTLSDRIERLRETLSDPTQTDFRIVMVPEEMSVVESKRLRTRLQEFDIPVGTVVVNRVMEPLADVTGDDSGEFLEPNLEDCAFCQRRWDVQQQALAEAQDLFRGTDVKRVPLFADEVRGLDTLEVVAACLRE